MGVVTGVLSGLLGVGGGFVLVPMMVYLLGMNQHRAHGTSLAVISMVVLSSAIFYSRHGHVDWLVAMEMMIGGVVGAAIGAKVCTLICARRLRRLFGILMILVGLRMLYGAAWAYAAHPVVAGHVISPYHLWGGLMVVGIGFITGILSGIFGIGGGIVMIPAMVLLLGFAQKTAQGISLAVIIPVSISGALIHSRQGTVRWGTAVWLGVGGIP
ncbi:MAG TPA: sulfite exporter TauE/SafE family protein, partial [Armatimonadota bacterium]|nr:sulfite exporter TauE/SafE family protein [Armatimonadota bacterium]